MGHWVDAPMGHVYPLSGMDLLPQLQGVLLMRALSVSLWRKKKTALLKITPPLKGQPASND